MKKLEYNHRFLWRSILWYTLIGLGVLILLVSVPVYIRQLGKITEIEQVRLSGTYPAIMQVDSYEYWLDLASMIIQLASSVACLGLATLIFRHRTGERMALLLSLFLFLLGTTISGPLQTLVEGSSFWYPVVSRFEAVLFAAWAVIFYIFPDGQFYPQWTRPMALALLPWVVITLLFRDFFSPLKTPESRQVVLLFLWYMIWPVSMLIAQTLRYQRHSAHIERQQTKWVIFGFLIIFGSLLLMFFLLLSIYVLRSEQGFQSAISLFSRSSTLVWYILISLVPITMGVAVLRYHLWNIDLILNRTLVYTTLTTLVVGFYILVVGGISVLFNSGGNFLISLLATGLVIVIVLPLRDFLQRAVNRLMYGERDDPYAVLTRLGQRLKESFTPESVLPTIVETVANTLKLPFVAIALKEGEEYKIAAKFALNPDNLDGNSKNEVFPLIYQSEKIGELILAPRSQEETFMAPERQLLARIADQAALAAYTVRLMNDLKDSRQRLITAREEERRHLRRELHDGMGSVLASLSFNLDAAANFLDRDPAATGKLLVELKIQTQAAMRDVRRLAYDLRPPVLDELGLAASLREFINKSNCPPDLHIELNIPEALPALPAAVEVAAYRISVEGINNMMHHSQARNGVVSISILDPQRLAVDINDDGQGLANSWHAGVGISAMRERTAELGGAFMIESNPGDGTHVGVTLPLSKE